MPGLKARIQWILDDLGIPARELARRAGLASEGHVSTAMKNGDIKLSTAIKICKAARVSIDWLATGDGSPRSGSPSLTEERVLELIRDAQRDPDETDEMRPIRGRR